MRLPLVFAAVVCALSAPGAVAQSDTSKIVKAANAYLGTLDQTQKQAVLFAFDDEQQRVRWSNLPVSMVPRKGSRHEGHEC